MLIDIMQKRINEIKQQDRKSYYEIANEIGISESTLYKLISKGELFTPAEQKIIAYLKGYLTKDEKLEAYRLDNEELKAENERLKKEVKYLEEEISDFISDISTCGFKYDDRCPDDLDELQCCIEDLCNKFDNYKQTLQEIKAIAEKEYNKKLVEKDCFDCDASLSLIVELITKAESEG